MDLSQDQNLKSKKMKIEKETSQPQRRSTRQIPPKPVPIPVSQNNNAVVKKTKSKCVILNISNYTKSTFALYLERSILPEKTWNILNEDCIRVIASKLDIEDCFCLEEAYPNTLVSIAVRQFFSGKKGLYLIMDPFVYMETIQYGFNFVYEMVNEMIIMPDTKTPLVSPLEDLEPNEKKSVIGYNTMLNLPLENIQIVFSNVKTLKIVMRTPSDEWIDHLCMVLQLFSEKLVSLQIHICDFFPENSRKLPYLKFINMIMNKLNTCSFPDLKHLLLDIGNLPFEMSAYENFHLNLIEKVEECYLNLRMDLDKFLNTHFGEIQSNDNLKKIGFIGRYRFGHRYDTTLFSNAEVAKKISHMYPFEIYISENPRIVNQIQLFSSLTHFRFTVTVAPDKNDYYKLLRNLRDLRNLKELSIVVTYKNDPALDRPEFQLLRLPWVNFLKLSIFNSRTKITDTFLDHNILTTLSVTRQFCNLKSFELYIDDRCTLCKRDFFSLKHPECYNQLVQPVTNFDHLEEFKTYRNQFETTNNQILQTIKDRREAVAQQAAR